jgi:hypothetical protein
VLHNGTWVVDQYTREADFTYAALQVPVLYDQPGFWGDSHMWVLPAAANEDPASVTRAGVRRLPLRQHRCLGRGTGHLANRTSVLTSGELDDAPQRENYADAADTAVFVPAVAGWAGRGMRSRTSSRPPGSATRTRQSALADAEARMNEELGNF